MTIGRRMALVASGAILLAGAAAPAWADLPASVRSATPADQYRQPIEKYVGELLARLQAADAKSSAAREELCKQVEASQTFTPSASFQTLYITAVLAALPPLQSNPDVMMRLNAAIIVSRLSAATGSNQMSPAVLKACADESPAVSLWGLKAAKSLMPSIMSTKLTLQNQTLTPAILGAAKAHKEVGAIVQDAYDALTLPEQKPPLPADALTVTALAVCDILDGRIAEYKAAVPADPQADKTALLYLSRTSNFSTLKPPQQLRIVQSVCNLMVTAARRAGAATPGTQRDDAYAVVVAAAGSLSAMSSIAGSPDTAAKFNELYKVPGVMRAEEITDKTIAAVGEVAKVKGFEAIKPPAA